MQLKHLASITMVFYSSYSFSIRTKLHVSWIYAVCFFSFYKGRDHLAAPIDFTFVGFTVVLPLVGFTWIAYQRRERSLGHLSDCKCLMISIINAFVQWNSVDSPLTEAQMAVSSLISAMHNYFLPGRFYSRRYPYLGYKSAMVQIALDRARALRQFRESIAALGTAVVNARTLNGMPSHLEATLHDRILQLSIAIERMSNVKEFGTSQGIRTMARIYICVIIPLFYAPYWAWINSQTDFSLGFFSSIVIQLALTGTLNAALALEDPFDNDGLDGIFIDEQLYEVEVLLAATGYSNAVVESASLVQNEPDKDAEFLPQQGTDTSFRTVRVATDNTV